MQRPQTLGLLLAAALLLGAAVRSDGGVTSLRLDSQPGDPFLGGHLFVFTPSDGTFVGSQSFSNSVSVNFHTPSYERWFYLNFAAPQGQHLSAGTYTGAMRFSGPGVAGLDISGDGVGCNTTTGQFEVKQADYGDGNELISFWAVFEQHCDGAVPALLGEIRFNANVPVVVTAPTAVSRTEGQIVGFTVMATESSNQRVTLTATNLPSGASFVDNGNNTGTFAWTPAPGQAGVYAVGFHGMNGVGASDNAATRILITLSNDDFTNAAVITTLPYASSFNIAGATQANDDPAYPCGYAAKTVWYALTASGQRRIEARASATNFAPLLGVFTGTRGNLETVACGSSPVQGEAQLSFNPQSGRTYYFLVAAGNSADAGTVLFAVNEVLPPPNDDIAHATPITTLPFHDRLNTTLATDSPSDPTSCHLYSTVWYTLTTAEDLFIDYDASQSDYRVAVGVFTGQPGALQYVQCIGNAQYGFAALAGRTYYLMVGSDYSGGGQLDISFRGRPKLKIGLTFDPVASLDSKTGAVTLRGTVTSSQPVTISLAGALRQKWGRRFISAEFPDPYGYLAVFCPGESPFSVRVVGDNGSFAGGHLLVNATAYAGFENDSAAVQISQTIKLNGSH